MRTKPIMTVAGAAMAMAAAGAPQILWMSDPVKPGEAVTVFGEGLEGVEWKVGGKGCKTLRSDGESAVFVLPADCGEGEIEVEGGGAKWTLNKAVEWWTIDDPDGGRWRFGKNLGGNGWKEKVGEGKKREEKAVKRFNIRDYGAVPNDTRDDTEAIQAALSAAEAAGGGVVWVPAGRYGMRGTIRLAEGCSLEGLATGKSMVYWPDMDEPEYAFVVMKSRTALRNLTLGSGNFHLGIVTEPMDKQWGMWGEEMCKDVRLENVRTRFLHTDVGKEEGLRRVKQPWYGYDAGLRLSAEDLVVRGCDFATTKTIGRLTCERGWITGNRFRFPDTLYLCGNRIVFEGNDCETTTVCYRNGSRFGYIAENVMGGMYGAPVFGISDRETFTFDLWRPCYYDYAETEGRKVKLRRGTKLTDEFGGFSNFRGFAKDGAIGHDSRTWEHHAISILAGKGRGQWREFRITGDLEVELKEEWKVHPDETSVYCICHCHANAVLWRNKVYDGNPMQAYGGSIEVYMVENELWRNSGINARAFYRFHPHVNWFVQMIGNVVADGCTLRGPASENVPAKYSCVGQLALSSGGTEKPYALSLCTVMRRNRLEGGACLAITGNGMCDYPLADSNFVEDNDTGVVVEAQGVKGMTVHGNRFRNVERKYVTAAEIAGDAGEGEVHKPRRGQAMHRNKGWYVKKIPLADGNVLSAAKGLVGADHKDLKYVRKMTMVCGQNEMVYARQTLRVARRMEVRFKFDHRAYKCALFVDGKRMGSSSRLGAPADVWLDAGEHVVEVLRTPFSRNEKEVRVLIGVVPFDGWKVGELQFADL